MAVEVPHKRAGTVNLVGNPIRFSKTPIADFAAPPDLGEHTEEVLRRILKADDERLAELRDKGAI
jgi:crotonobetainyl-CoA:carnitine CoA-transferase CaiB-like acyl-CoA transferase